MENLNIKVFVNDNLTGYPHTPILNREPLGCLAPLRLLTDNHGSTYMELHPDGYNS